MKKSLFLAACVLLVIACHREKQVAATEPSKPAPLATFPPLGPAKPVEPGVVVHEVSLAHGDQPGRIWIYLPETLPAKPMPCIFIAPAGVPPFVGNGFGTDLDKQQHPEHVPYVHAGFAVVAYDVDGEVANLQDATYDQVLAAATAFQNAEAGMLNARNAIDYVLKMVPSVDPKRLYAAGHSSAGRIALLLAENEPRIAACVAYAPVTDAERRAERNAPEVKRFLAENIAGFSEFLKRSSPIQRIDQLRCPTFVFHSEHDTVIDIRESEAFVEQLKKTNANATFTGVTRGDHFDAMVEQGIPQAIEWLEGLNKPEPRRPNPKP